ncbi:MAG: isomerase [Flavobacteriales bacterium]|nr:isomerase [Flavobacteriales bacterium]MBO73340.1 isomerase [Flavobacteriales bacterium]|tara:strand:+ start:1040 stop:1819 length:780 start_codon:yes stop_codon:yes gene_type:complete
MKLDIYQVDAFTSELFKGNPAAVVPLPYWINDDLMLNIAAENNLSETAFYVCKNEEFEIRWFTPTVEVKLCGHATLAAAFVIFEKEGFKNDQIVFNSKSGVLTVNKSIDGLALDFPIINPELIEIPEWISFIGGDPKEAYLCGDDYLFIYDSEKNVRELKPSFSALKEVKARGFICSSKSNSCDFVSRFFAPRAGINEDPVTGSAHTKLVPYWAGIYKKNNFFARQISVRGGELKCILTGDRVKIQGAVRLYMKGELYL